MREEWHDVVQILPHSSAHVVVEFQLPPKIIFIYFSSTTAFNEPI